MRKGGEKSPDECREHFEKKGEPKLSEGELKGRKKVAMPRG